jgi:hypothetical protein
MTSKSMQKALAGTMVVASAIGVLGTVGGLECGSIDWVVAIFYIFMCVVLFLMGSVLLGAAK